MSQNYISIEVKKEQLTNSEIELISQLQRFISSLNQVEDLRDIADNIEQILEYNKYLGYRFYITSGKYSSHIHKQKLSGLYQGILARIYLSRMEV